MRDPITKRQPTQRRWAVISAHYVNFDLTHAEARREADDLRRRGQLGASVITNNAAYKALISNQTLATELKAAA